VSGVRGIKRKVENQPNQKARKFLGICFNLCEFLNFAVKHTLDWVLLDLNGIYDFNKRLCLYSNILFIDRINVGFFLILPC